MSVVEVVGGAVLGGAIGGVVAAWGTARLRQRQFDALAARIDSWGHRLHAGHQELVQHLDVEDDAMDPRVLSAMTVLDQRGPGAPPPR